MNKKILTTTIISMSIGLLLVVGFSVAFFSAKVFGNDNANNTVIETKTLRIIFTDTEVLSLDKAIPGQSATKTFTVENRGDVEIEYTIDIENLTNTFVNGDLVYSLTSTNGGATANEKAIPTTSGTLETATIEPGVTQTYTIEILFKETGSNQNSNMGAIFGGVLQISSRGRYGEKLTLTETMLAAETAQSDENIDFSYTSEGWNANGEYDESQVTNGLYYTSDLTRTEDLDGDGTGEVVYYYRGAVENNYVAFGSLCWRIVRTVEDGSVRIFYSGIAAIVDDEVSCPEITYGYIADFNNKYNDSASIDYRTSVIKNEGIDSFFYLLAYLTNEMGTTEEFTKFGDLIADTPYCNDMSEYIVDGSSVLYGAGGRLLYEINNWVKPQYKCASSDYAYTVAKEDLTIPAALLTADEVAYAGGSLGVPNNTYFLYQAYDESSSGEPYLTMSPYAMVSDIYAMFYIDSDGALYFIETSSELDSGILPLVISLKGEATVEKGTGLYNDPYIIEPISMLLVE